MKILITSDMHGNLDNLDFTDIDLAFFAGDIAKLNRRGAWHVYDQIKWMNKQFANMCKSWPKTKFIFVPGNHDFFPIAKERFRTELRGHDLSIKLPENCTMLIDQEINVFGLKIYGTPWVPIISHSWAFEAEHDFLKEKFRKIPENLDVLITHAPPHIENSHMIDRSLQWGVSKPFGSSELAEAIFEKKPRYVFCGHIHTGDHEKTMFNESIIYNVARVDERYEIAYEPLILNI